MTSLNKRIEAQRRHYAKALMSLEGIIKGELEAVDGDAYEASTAIDLAAFQVIQRLNQLKALLEVEE
jgi:hypothetical protein